MNAVRFVDPRSMQHELFRELSDMFGREVPMYDRALAVNASCNRAVCDVLGAIFPGFSISDDLIEQTSRERHGAIRIGRPDEYRWICRFFACFAMRPHNFYDMTSIGAKSQPITATAFRSTIQPEHRVFTSLLQTSYFDDDMQNRLEALLQRREVFTPLAKALVEKCEQQGGLAQADADALIREGTEHIFKWKGQARDPDLYHELCANGFKIAADIACFTTHHLNHLTPNTLCIDLYTAAMRLCMDEIEDERFIHLAEHAIESMNRWMDHHGMVLHFKHLNADDIRALPRVSADQAMVARRVSDLLGVLKDHKADFSTLRHNGFKDYTEGPDAETLVLLRQDAYKALSEPVEFIRDDGTVTTIEHTSRFGEIEQRYFAPTPNGRALYDQCLDTVNALLAQQPDLPKRDQDAFERLRTDAFSAFPDTFEQLLGQELVHAIYEPTERGLAHAGSIDTADLGTLLKHGFVRVEGLRHEDFLPVSAAGIFASNLNQYGTQSTATNKTDYTRAMLESVLDRPIIDTIDVYAGMEAESILETYGALGLLSKLPDSQRADLERRVAVYTAATTDALATGSAGSD